MKAFTISSLLISRLKRLLTILKVGVQPSNPNKASVATLIRMFNRRLVKVSIIFKKILTKAVAMVTVKKFHLRTNKIIKIRTLYRFLPGMLTTPTPLLLRPTTIRAYRLGLVGPKSCTPPIIKIITTRARHQA